MRANGCSERTIDNYLYALKGFTRFLGERPLASASADDIVAYQVQIAATGRSDSSVRVATYALRGFFRQVLERTDWNWAKLPRPRRPRRLPEVLSAEEVQAILDAAPNPKYRCRRARHPPACRPDAPWLYTHLAKTWLSDVKSPLDSLKDKDKTSIA